MGSQDATGSTAIPGSKVIDDARRLLADFSRCPSCAVVLPGNRCPNCGIDLADQNAGRVGELSMRAVALLVERESVLDVMRIRARGLATGPANAPVALTKPQAASSVSAAGQSHPASPSQAAAPQSAVHLQVPPSQVASPAEAVSPSDTAVPPPAPPSPAASPAEAAAPQPASGVSPSWASPTPPLAPTTSAPPTAPPPPPAPPGRPVPPPAEGRSGLGVHGLLVGLGALLLSVAAVGFLVFSWQVLSLSGRAAVIAAVTLGVLGTASWLRARLPETAEAVGALGVVLVLADSWAVRRTGLFGADRPEALGYAAGAVAVCAVVLGGWALISRVRAGSLAAVTLAPLAVLLLAARLDGDLGPVPVMATGFLLAAGLALGRGLLPADWQAERWLLRAIAAAAVAEAGGSASIGRPGHWWAAFVLVTAAVVTVAEAFVDRPAVLPGRDWPVLLRRAWSLTAGLLVGAAAAQVGLAVAAALDLTESTEITLLIPVTALTVLAAVGAAAVRSWPGAAIRRSAFGAGTVIVAALVAVPLVAIAGWLPVRAALVGAQAWSARPGSRFGDLAPEPASTMTTWLVALIGLGLLAAGGLIVVRISGWPAWLLRPIRFATGTVAGLGVVVLPLIPAAPVAVVVVGSAGVSVLLAVLLTGSAGAARRATRFAGGWILSGVTGTLAALLAWSCRDLALPFSLLGIAGLLLARRRVPRTGPAGAPVNGAGLSALAGLAGAAAPFAVGAAVGLAGGSSGLRVVWAAGVGGLSAAALIGVPRWWPAAREGRAEWTGIDRLAAAIPGMISLVVGLLATLPGAVAAPSVLGDTWPRPTLLAVAVVIGLTGALLIRPDVVRALPVLPLTCAAAVTPLLGATAAAIRAAITEPGPAWIELSLLWAVAAALGALGIAALALSGRADPARRVAAELGVLITGLIGLALIDGPDALWPVLLVLGAGAAAIAATPDRHRVGWLAGFLLTGSTWTRLAVGDVSLVEAYSVPPALALLVLAGYRFWRDRETDPVRALVPVATVGLAPSILVAADGTPIRPAVLIAVATGLASAGWLMQRRGTRPLSGTGTVITGIGVLTAAATAGVRAGATLSTASTSIDLPLSGVEVWTLPAAAILLFAASVGRAVPESSVSSEAAARTGRRSELLQYAARPPLFLALLMAAVPTLIAALLLIDDSGDDGWAVVRVAAVLGVSALAILVALADRLGSGRFGQGRLEQSRLGPGWLRSGWLGSGWLSPAGAGRPGPARAGSGRVALEPVAVALAVAASWTGLRLDAGPPEVWTLPLAVLLLIQGQVRFEKFTRTAARPGGVAASWAAYGPGLVVLLLPSLYLNVLSAVSSSSAEGSILRQSGLILLAAAVLVVGARHRLQAPVLLGAGVLIVQAGVVLSPWIAELAGAVPLWGWLAAVGLALIVLGARYEARVRQLRMVRLRLGALR
jgi:hypothetical protein